MRKTSIVLSVLAIISILFLSITNIQTTQTEYLRIHIRANSNSQIDQQIKYQIKDQVVAFLTPIIAECNTLEKAERLLTDNLDGVEKVCDTFLQSQGFEYRSKAKVKNEQFPLRVYQDLTLEEGIYRALIIELGEGVGDNWWCVVYPPLCFVSNGGATIYKSKILEIIKDFREKHRQ